MKEVEMGRIGESGDCLVVEHFVEVYRRRQVNASKSELIVLGWDEGLEWRFL